MSEELRLYYLQQMGLDVWLLRNKDISVSVVSLMVINEVIDDIDEMTKSKTHQLLNSMLRSIGLSIKPTHINTFVDSNLHDRELDHVNIEYLEVRSTTDFSCDLDILHDAQQDYLKVDLIESDDKGIGFINLSFKQILKNKITSIRPRFILALGESIVDWFVGQGALFSNGLYDYQGIVILKSYSPYHLLTNPKDKKNAYNDLLQVNKLLVQLA